MTILMPFLIVALALLPLWLANLKDSGTKKIAVAVIPEYMLRNSQSNKEYNFELIHQNDTSGLMQQLGDKLFAILTITDDLSKTPKPFRLFRRNRRLWTCNRTSKNTLSSA